MPQTLIINTYAGSLLLGVNANPGANIVGSYEDCGFGSPITKANRARFTEASPDFHFVDHMKHWPDRDLSETIVLAHPPCAAFSQQNTSKTNRGTETDAFECTRKVLKYTFANNAAAVAVESVMGALGGAWDVHDHLADVGGYHVYRILKNSMLFGVPQFRERFWCVFVRKDLANPQFTWRLSPKVVNVRSVLDPIVQHSTVHHLDRAVTKFVTRLVQEHGFDDAEVRSVGLAHQATARRRSFSYLITERFFPGQDYKIICRKFISPFSSGQPSILAEGGYTPVLLGSSLWIYRGQPVSEEGYKAVMGFPTDYVFPEGAHRNHLRTYLSKGVCPPVARWIHDNLWQHVFGGGPRSPFTAPGAYEKTIGPGKIASFRPGTMDVRRHLSNMYELGSPESDELIPLRDEEAALEE